MPRIVLRLLVVIGMLSLVSTAPLLAQDQKPTAPHAAKGKTAAKAPAAPAAAAPAASTPAAAATAPVAPAAVAAAGVSTANTPTVAGEPEEPKHIDWPFNGMLGHVDKQAAQRGFQVYKEVCSACHSMDQVTYRSLTQLGFSEAEVKAIAAEKQVADFDDNGQPIQRPGQPYDHFVPPFPNEKASRAANGGAYPPDLSLIIKAREGGGDYVYSILTGFSPAPPSESPVAGKYYNPYFSGHWISMPPPLMDNRVTYQDGTPATVDQMARDVVTFLQWAAEPEMEQRHEMGIRVLLYLLIMAGFLYVAKKRVWRKIGH